MNKLFNLCWIIFVLSMIYMSTYVLSRRVSKLEIEMEYVGTVAHPDIDTNKRSVTNVVQNDVFVTNITQNVSTSYISGGISMRNSDLVSVNLSNFYNCTVKSGPGIYDTTIAKKTFQDTNGFYLIKFEYRESFVMRPATSPMGCAHYNAKITVFVISNGVPVQIGESFKGIFTDGKCYEDNPGDLVYRAKFDTVKDILVNTTSNVIRIATNCLATNSLWKIPTNTYLINDSIVLNFASNGWVASCTSSVTNVVSDGKIRELAKEGRVCSVLGHVWEITPVVTLLYSPKLVGQRRCGVCGKVQKQYAGDWE